MQRRLERRRTVSLDYRDALCVCVHVSLSFLFFVRMCVCAVCGGVDSPQPQASIAPLQPAQPPPPLRRVLQPVVLCRVPPLLAPAPSSVPQPESNREIDPTKNRNGEDRSIIRLYTPYMFDPVDSKLEEKKAG